MSDKYKKDRECFISKYKTVPCKFSDKCAKQDECSFYHNDKERRRIPHPADSRPCEKVFDKNTKKWNDPIDCNLNEKCKKCHSQNEFNYHPENYEKREPCKYEQSCTDPLCYRKHKSENKDFKTGLMKKKLAESDTSVSGSINDLNEIDNQQQLDNRKSMNAIEKRALITDSHPIVESKDNRSSIPQSLLRDESIDDSVVDENDSNSKNTIQDLSLDSLIVIGEDNLQNKNIDAAIELFNQAEMKLENESDSNNDELKLRIKKNLAECFKEKGDYSAVLKYRREIVEITKKKLANADHPEIAEALIDLSDAYKCLAYLPGEIEYRYESLMMYKRMFKEMKENPSDDFKEYNKIICTKDLLGQGGYSKVYKGKFNGIDVAVKKIEHKDALNEKNILLETVKSIPHENVIRFFAFEEHTEENNYWIALELCSFTLDSFLKRNKLNKQHQYNILKQCSKGLMHLHENAIIHRDIKPSNILVKREKFDPNPRILLTDFNISKIIENDGPNLNSRVGTQGFRAPEIVNGTSLVKDLKKIDIFSLGCVFHMVLTKNNEHPFGGEEVHWQSNIVKNIFKLNSLMDFDESKLIKKMIEHEPSKRLNIQDIVYNPLFWSSKRKLDFYHDVSDILFSDGSSLQNKLNQKSNDVLDGYDWFEQRLCQNLRKELLEYQKKNPSSKYNGKCLSDLVRCIRNLGSHSNNLKINELKVIFRNSNLSIDYISKRFPKLMFHVYDVIKKEQPKPEKLSEYFFD